MLALRFHFLICAVRVKRSFQGKLTQGDHSIGFNTSEIAPGTYLLKISDGSNSNYRNLIIAR
jgi:hypothetical protein